MILDRDEVKSGVRFLVGGLAGVSLWVWFVASYAAASVGPSWGVGVGGVIALCTGGVGARLLMKRVEQGVMAQHPQGSKP